MWKAVFACAMLATMTATGSLMAAQPAAAQTAVITEGHIARLKAALQLTGAQQRHWPAVAAALRGLSRANQTGGSAQGMRQHASAAVGTANALRRVIAAARPLIGSLTAEQKQAGLQVIRASGFSHLASAL